MSMWWRTIVVWFALMGAETIHGILRRVLLEPVVGDFRARQISVFTGALIILVVAYLFVPWFRTRSTRSLFLIGLAWLALTVTFEVLLGRFMHLSWERILSDYNLAQGGLMPIGLLVLLFSPLIAARLRVSILG